MTASNNNSATSDSKGEKRTTINLSEKEKRTIELNSDQSQQRIMHSLVLQEPLDRVCHFGH